MSVSKQHYVPKFYLKNFENINHSIERLDVKNASLMKEMGKSGLCYEEYFYGLITGEPDSISQYVEKSLKMKEDIISKELPRLIEKFLGDEQIITQDKQLIAVFLVMQHFRGPMFRNQLNEMMQSGLSQMMTIVKNLPKSAISKFLHKRFANSLSLKEIDKLVDGELETPNFNNLLHLQIMDDIVAFSNLLWGQDWMIYRNQTNTPFITSDNPVAIEPLKTMGFYSGSFIDYTYHFTLTPNLHIVTKPPRDLSLKFNKVHRKTLTKEFDILTQNIQILNSCQQYVFSNSKLVLSGLLQVLLEYRETKS